MVPATLAPGGQELISLTGVGPGPAIQDGLQQNKIHHLAVRAMDDAGRMSEISQVVVDLTMNQRTANVEPILGQLDDSDFFNQGSQIIGAGDLDGDGLNDTLVVGSQAAASVASLIFGALDQDALTVLPSRFPIQFFKVSSGSAQRILVTSMVMVLQLTLLSLASAKWVCWVRHCHLFLVVMVLVDRSTLATPDGIDHGKQWPIDLALLPQPAILISVLEMVRAWAIFFSVGVSQLSKTQRRPLWCPAGPIGRCYQTRLFSMMILQIAAMVSSSLTVPDGKAGYAGASAGNISGDARDDLVFSAGNPSVIYRFNGGVDLPDSITYVPNNPDTAVVPHVCSADPMDTVSTSLVGKT